MRTFSAPAAGFGFPAARRRPRGDYLNSVVVRGLDNRIYENVDDDNNGVWSGWSEVPAAG